MWFYPFESWTSIKTDFPCRADIDQMAWANALYFALVKFYSGFPCFLPSGWITESTVPLPSASPELPSLSCLVTIFSGWASVLKTHSSKEIKDGGKTVSTDTWVSLPERSSASCHLSYQFNLKTQIFQQGLYKVRAFDMMETILVMMRTHIFQTNISRFYTGILLKCFEYVPAPILVCFIPS